MLLIYEKCHKNSCEVVILYGERFPPAHMAFFCIKTKMWTDWFPSNLKHSQHITPVITEEMQKNILTGLYVDGLHLSNSS